MRLDKIASSAARSILRLLDVNHRILAVGGLGCDVMVGSDPLVAAVDGLQKTVCRAGFLLFLCAPE